MLPLRAATAAETGGCKSFAWPLSTEIAWMNASESETILSGAKLAAPPNNAISMTLLPVAKVSFSVALNGKPKGDTAEAFGGIAFFEGVSAPGFIKFLCRCRAGLTSCRMAWLYLLKHTPEIRLCCPPQKCAV